MPDREWERYWASLRIRRIGAALALAFWIAAWIGLGPLGLGVGFAVAFSAYVYLRAWPCPRCGLLITGAGLRTFVDRCSSCGLLIFGASSDVRWPASSNPEALSLPLNLRRFVAGYQILSGSTLVILTLFVHGVWWVQILLEGFAGLSLAAGIWLWRDDPRGYSVSRSLQVVQMVRIQSPWVTYVATSGVYVDLYHAGETIALGPGFTCAFSLFVSSGRPLGVAVNLWAAILALVLIHARPTSINHRAERESLGDTSAPVA
jgi:hypothetical protein